ncbi:MAG: hypothetical protein GX112_00015 [Clostridiaceae bacterium]|nr:hypothetical protein [Clostridiaceae bacterium]
MAGHKEQGSFFPKSGWTFHVNPPQLSYQVRLTFFILQIAIQKRNAYYQREWHQIRFPDAGSGTGRNPCTILFAHKWKVQAIHGQGRGGVLKAMGLIPDCAARKHKYRDLVSQTECFLLQWMRVIPCDVYSDEFVGYGGPAYVFFS